MTRLQRRLQNVCLRNVSVTATQGINTNYGIKYKTFQQCFYFGLQAVKGAIKQLLGCVQPLHSSRACSAVYPISIYCFQIQRCYFQTHLFMQILKRFYLHSYVFLDKSAIYKKRFELEPLRIFKNYKLKYYYQHKYLFKIQLLQLRDPSRLRLYNSTK